MADQKEEGLKQTLNQKTMQLKALQEKCELQNVSIW